MLWANHSTTTIEASSVNLISWRNPPGWTPHMWYINMHISQKKLKQIHGEAVERLGRYLITTHDQGIILWPTDHQSYECWVDADFAGGFNHKIAASSQSIHRSM